jgi:hypothetical protein
MIAARRGAHANNWPGAERDVVPIRTHPARRPVIHSRVLWR